MQSQDFSPQPSRNLLSYNGKLSRIYGIWIKNVLLQIVTLTLYRAWGKTNMRRYVWRSFSVAGDRLEYTGKGGELLRGYMKVALIVFGLSLVGLIAALIFAEGPVETSPLLKLSDYAIFLFVIYLLYYGKFSALRYRMVRTRWRGVRGMLDGNPNAYVLFRIKRLFINIFTLGYFIGRSDLLDNAYIAKSIRLGSQRCTYHANIKSLDRINLITLLLAIPTLAISRYWYQAALLNTKYNHLRAGSVHFHSTFTGGQLLRLKFGNLLILIFTLFLGVPIVIQRTLRVFAFNVKVLGDIEGTTILQEPAKAGNLGEGIEDAAGYDGFDFDMGII